MSSASWVTDRRKMVCLMLWWPLDLIHNLLFGAGRSGLRTLVTAPCQSSQNYFGGLIIEMQCEDLQVACLLQPAGGDPTQEGLHKRSWLGGRREPAYQGSLYEIKWPHWTIHYRPEVRTKISPMCQIKHQVPLNIVVMGHGRWLSVGSLPQRTTKECPVFSRSFLSLMNFARCSFAKQPWRHKYGSCLSLWLEGGVHSTKSLAALWVNPTALFSSLIKISVPTASSIQESQSSFQALIHSQRWSGEVTKSRIHFLKRYGESGMEKEVKTWGDKRCNFIFDSKCIDVIL